MHQNRYETKQLALFVYRMLCGQGGLAWSQGDGLSSLSIRWGKKFSHHSTQHQKNDNNILPTHFFSEIEVTLTDAFLASQSVNLQIQRKLLLTNYRKNFQSRRLFERVSDWRDISAPLFYDRDNWDISHHKLSKATHTQLQQAVLSSNRNTWLGHAWNI